MCFEQSLSSSEELLRTKRTSRDPRESRLSGARGLALSAARRARPACWRELLAQVEETCGALQTAALTEQDLVFEEEDVSSSCETSFELLEVFCERVDEDALVKGARRVKRRISSLWIVVVWFGVQRATARRFLNLVEDGPRLGGF